MNLVNKLREISKKYKLNENLNLKLVGNDGEVFEGPYSGFTQALDNEPEIASIEIKMNGHILSLDENEIRSIEVI